MTTLRSALSPLLVALAWTAGATTAQTPVQLGDLWPGPNGSLGGHFGETMTTVYFAARNDLVGMELFRTDGTPGTTALVKDIRRGRADSSPREFVQLPDGRVLFTAAGALGDEPWVSDGTAAGTVQLADINPGPASSTPRGYTWNAFHQVFAFAADDGVHGAELWHTDGTPQGTVLVQDIHPGPIGSFPADFRARHDGSVFFTATDDTHGTELWIYDEIGLPRVVSDLSAGIASSFPAYPTVVDDFVFFFALDHARGVGQELWCTDGSPSGTMLVKDIWPGRNGSFSPGLASSFVALAGELFFVAATPQEGSELWRSNGTPGGTVMVADLSPGPASSFVGDLTVAGDHLFFTAIDPNRGHELFVLPAGGATPMRIDVEPGPGSSTPMGLAAVGDAVYFGASVAAAGLFPTLWRADASGTLTLADATLTFPTSLAATRHGLLFNAFEPTTGQEPYALRTTEARVVCIGQGCGRARPTLEVTPPVLGAPIEFSGRATNSSGGALAIALQAAVPIRADGCTFYGDPAVMILLNVRPNPVDGTWSLGFVVPDNPSLIDVVLIAQGVFFTIVNRPVVSTTPVKALLFGR